METASLDLKEIVRRGELAYARSVRPFVETPENIGRMVVIDVDTEEYKMEDLDLSAAPELQARHPNALLYGKRIGFDVACELGGFMERTTL